MSASLRIPVTEVLDEAVDTVRSLFVPWVGILMLGVLPFRLLFVHLVLELLDAGEAAGELASYFRELAWMLVAACLLATLARAVFARACHLGMAARISPGMEAARLGASEAAACIAVGLIALVVVNATWFMVFTLPLVAIALGLGLALAHGTSQPGPVAHAGRIVRAVTSSNTPLLLAIVLGCAVMVGFVTIIMSTSFALWLAGGIFGLDPGAASVVLSPEAPHALMLYASLALMLVEPFWLAAFVSFVRRLRASSSGEDLRAWLLRLSASRAR